MNAKKNLQTFLNFVGRWFDLWLDKQPSRDLVRIAHSSVMKINLRLEKALKR